MVRPILRPETTWGKSRFDFYWEAGDRKGFVEVKGVTLELDGVVLFPDAPTERGVKHINELVDAAQNGFETYIFFVIQMNDCKYFTPNAETHPEFAQSLRNAEQNGVNIRTVNCNVTENELKIRDFVEIKL